MLWQESGSSELRSSVDGFTAMTAVGQGAAISVTLRQGLLFGRKADVIR
jgi:hypothetical protein